MNLADVIVSAIIIGLLIIVFYVTRAKKGNSGCGSCTSDCSSCHALSNFYEDYKKDEADKKLKE